MAIRVQYMKNISFSRVFLLSSSEEQGRIDFEFQGSAQDWKATPCCACRRAFIIIITWCSYSSSMSSSQTTTTTAANNIK